MDILLIAGLWLDGSVWDNVAAQLEARGHHAVPITLPAPERSTELFQRMSRRAPDRVKISFS